MNMRTARFAIGLCIFLLSLMAANSTRAQGTGATLSGTVTAASGGVASVKVSVKNLATQELTQALTDSAGRYSMPDLAAGDYETFRLRERRCHHHSCR